MKTPRTETAVLVAALRILERDIQSGDGVANAAIAEAADRLAELEREVAALRAEVKVTRQNYEAFKADNIALRADKERLDWLAVTDVWFDEPATESYTPETFRAEIDRKRKAQP